MKKNGHSAPPPDLKMAQAVIEQAMLERARICTNEVNAALSRHNCALIVKVVGQQGNTLVFRCTVMPAENPPTAPPETIN